MPDDQEQVTIYERLTHYGLQRWAVCSDGKTVEMPFEHWRTAHPFIYLPPDLILDMPAEENSVECTAIVHLPDGTLAPGNIPVLIP